MSAILPGGTVGILGGGQLGRMLAMEAHRMGYRVGIFDPIPHCPGAQVADFHIQSEFTNGQGLGDFVRQVDVVTIETELVPSALLADIEATRATRPANQILALVQDRLLQRTFLEDHHFPQTTFANVTDPASLAQARNTVAFPGILKTRHSGYDGKGQIHIAEPGALTDAWQSLHSAPCLLESLVPFQKELSIVLARGLDGDIRIFPLAENVHQKNILHATRVPAQVDEKVHSRAEALAASLAEKLHYCGVMAVEFFFLADQTLLINEISPRPHNSGHFTWGGCVTSQFEQHLRAICGLPLGDPSLLQPVLMVNLLGDLWQHGNPHWEHLLMNPYVRLHLYGKEHPRPGRKMGHFLYFGDQHQDVRYQSKELLQKLGLKRSTNPDPTLKESQGTIPHILPIHSE